MKVNGRIQLFPILRIVAFLSVGIIAGEQLYGTMDAYAWFIGFAAALAAAFLARRMCIAQTVLIFVSFVFLGGCLASYELSKMHVDFPGQAVRYSAVIVSPPVVSGKVVRCDMVVTDRQRPFKIRASIFRDGRAENLRAGDGITGMSVISPPSNFIASDFDYRRYLLYHGIVGTTFLYLDDWAVADVDLRDLSYIERTKIAALSFRNRLLDKFKDVGMDAQDYAVFAAMTLGERVSISRELNDDYSVSGALHILSLSGMHLAIIYAILTLLLLKGNKTVLGVVLIVCAIWAYVFIAGLPVSAVRSAIMLTVYSFIGLLNRDRMSLNTLSLAALIVLICNPLNFYDVGFQMSFVSVMFIVVFYRPVYLFLPTAARDILPVRWIWQMTAVSLAAQIGVAPLVAFYFGRFSCYFILSNFIVIPASTVILYGAVLLFVTWWWPFVQDLLCRMLACAVSFMNDGVSFIASLPGASIEGIRMNLVQLVLVYVIIFSVYALSLYVKKMRWQRFA